MQPGAGTDNQKQIWQWHRCTTEVAELRLITNFRLFQPASNASFDSAKLEPNFEGPYFDGFPGEVNYYWTYYIYNIMHDSTSKDFLITCDHLLHPVSLVYFSKASVLQPVLPKCRHLRQCTQFQSTRSIHITYTSM